MCFSRILCISVHVYVDVFVCFVYVWLSFNYSAVFLLFVNCCIFFISGLHIAAVHSYVIACKYVTVCNFIFIAVDRHVNMCCNVSRGVGAGGSGGSNDSLPPEIYLGVKHGILTPQFFGNIMLYGPTGNRHYNYINSETRSRTVFCYHFNRFPRNVALMILMPQSKNSSRAPECFQHNSDSVL